MIDVFFNWDAFAYATSKRVREQLSFVNYENKKINQTTISYDKL